MFHLTFNPELEKVGLCSIMPQNPAKKGGVVFHFDLRHNLDPGWAVFHLAQQPDFFSGRVKILGWVFSGLTRTSKSVTSC